MMDVCRNLHMYTTRESAANHVREHPQECLFMTIYIADIVYFCI